MRNRIMYPLAAFAMGVPWFVVLLPFRGGLPLGGPDWPANLAAMCLTSLTVAMAFRRPFLRAEGPAYHALALPGTGAFVFGYLVVVRQWASLAFRPGDGLSPGVLLIPLYCVAFGAWLPLFVTVPTAYLSQRTIRRLGLQGLDASGNPSRPDRCPRGMARG